VTCRKAGALADRTALHNVERCGSRVQYKTLSLSRNVIFGLASSFLLQQQIKVEAIHADARLGSHWYFSGVFHSILGISWSSISGSFSIVASAKLSIALTMAVTTITGVVGLSRWTA
jgi:hypothetical protein